MIPATDTAASEPVVRLRRLRKTYPGVAALRDVKLDLFPGECHMLLGENGAGKSTLVKILAGAVAPDVGSEVWIDGQAIIDFSPRRARDLGISVIYQELNLIPTLSAAQNMSLAREPLKRWGRLDHEQMRSKAQQALSRLGIELDVSRPVERLSVAQQQLVEIGAALLDDCRVLILDEPTSALSQDEVDKLGAVLQRLKQNGVAILYVTHRFEEVFSFGDRATILRDGKWIDECSLQAVSKAQLIRGMVGRDVEDIFPKRQVELGEPLLQVTNLCSAKGIQDVSFTLRRGEIVALAGLMGSGRTELARALFGLDEVTGGTIALQGEPIPAGSVRRSIARGLSLVPEDRKLEGLVLSLSVGRNITLAGLRKLLGKLGQIVGRQEQSAVTDLSRKLSIKSYSDRQLAGTLSGGNQQKVVLAKWLHAASDVFILDEPTRGIDVGAKHEIYTLMNELVASGAAILMISSELPEVLGMADRLLVMNKGRIQGELSTHDATADRVLELATA